MTENRSGQQIGQEYVHILKRYLDSLDKLPARNGKVNMTAVAEASGVPRQSLYKNDDCQKLLAEAITAKGLLGVEKRDDEDTEKVIKLQRRLTTMEQTNAALVAENHELRRQLKKLYHVEELLEQGKRVIP